MEKELRKFVEERNRHLTELGGCSDGFCIISKPQGQHTNGGCQCNRDMVKMRRYASINNIFNSSIEELIMSQRWNIK